MPLNFLKFLKNLIKVIAEMAGGSAHCNKKEFRNRSDTTEMLVIPFIPGSGFR